VAESKSKSGPTAIFIAPKLLKSKAYFSLTGKAPQVLGMFWYKRKVRKKPYSKLHVITNNGEIEFTYREAVAYGISKSTFTRALDELIEKGFIDIAHSGGQLQGDKTKYALSIRWMDYGQEGGF